MRTACAAVVLLLYSINSYCAVEQSGATSTKPVLQFVESVSDYDLAIDIREREDCQQSTLARAVCAPLTDWIGPHRRPVATLSQLATKPGKLRANTRIEVFVAPMQSDLVLLPGELAAALHSIELILDGRTEREYWGASLRGANRGGHIPGAMQARSADPDNLPTAVQAVVYAHDGFDSLVYFARLTAAGVQASVLLGGWQAWLADGSLPVDAESFNSTPLTSSLQASSNSTIAKAATAYPLGALVAAALSSAVLTAIAITIWSRSGEAGRSEPGRSEAV